MYSKLQIPAKVIRILLGSESISPVIVDTSNQVELNRNAAVLSSCFTLPTDMSLSSFYVDYDVRADAIFCFTMRHLPN